MHAPTPLFLHEEVMLLCLEEEEGKMEFGAWYQQAVAAAVMAELLLAGRVELEDPDKKKLVRVRSTEPLGNELIDEWIQTLAADSKERKLTHWTAKIGGSKDLKGRVARALADKRILKVEEGKVLLFFSVERYPERDARPEREIRARLRKAVMGSGAVEPRTAALLAIAKAASLLRFEFDKHELKERKERIERVVAGQAAGEAVDQAIQAAQAAVVAAVIVPTIIT